MQPSDVCETTLVPLTLMLAAWEQRRFRSQKLSLQRQPRSRSTTFPLSMVCAPLPSQLSFFRTRDRFYLREWSMRVSILRPGIDVFSTNERRGAPSFALSLPFKRRVGKQRTLACASRSIQAFRPARHNLRCPRNRRCLVAESFDPLHVGLAPKPRELSLGVVAMALLRRGDPCLQRQGAR